MSYSLCLNSGWFPVNILDHKDVFRLLCKEHAKAMDEDFVLHTFESWLNHHGVYEKKKKHHGLSTVSTVSLEIPQPEIIVLTEYGDVPRRDLIFSKENLFIRDLGKCCYCSKELSYKDATIDHIHPQSKGGQSTFENCVISCSECNHSKDDYLLDEIKHTHKLKVHPRHPNTTNPLYRFHNRIKILPSWEKFLIHKM